MPGERTNISVMALGDFFRNLFGRSDQLDRLSVYVIREHERGRPLAEILEDPYIRNRTTPQERERLLDKPEVIRAIGDDTVAETRARLPG
jgi:hypothetical protein